MGTLLLLLLCSFKIHKLLLKSVMSKLNGNILKASPSCWFIWVIRLFLLNYSHCKLEWNIRDKQILLQHRKSLKKNSNVDWVLAQRSQHAPDQKSIQLELKLQTILLFYTKQHPISSLFYAWHLPVFFEILT